MLLANEWVTDSDMEMQLRFVREADEMGKGSLAVSMLYNFPLILFKKFKSFLYFEITFLTVELGYLKVIQR